MNILASFDAAHAAAFGVSDYVAGCVLRGPLPVGSGEILARRKNRLPVLLPGNYALRL